MKRILLIIVAIIFIHLFSYRQMENDSSKANFYKAYTALLNMHEGKESLNYKKL